MEIISPLRVRISKNKMFTLNLNIYRNAHYQELNTAKIEYKKTMLKQIRRLKSFNKISVHYQLFPQTKRLTDLGNVVSIHKKFFEDALVEFEKLEDDNYLFIISNSESFGKVDKDNPRVVITIREEY